MAHTPALSTEVAPVEIPTLKAVNGHGMATSLQVAERFGKRHDTVLRAIQNLECSPGYRLRNFAESSYLNRQGKSQPMVEMTRDGFVMLAMGFTGPQAMAWKESFIEAFNQLEQAYLQRLQDDARLAIEARDNQLFLKTAKWKEELAHRNAGEALIRKIKAEPDSLLRRHHFNTLSSLYRRLGDEPPTFEEIGQATARFVISTDVTPLTAEEIDEAQSARGITRATPKGNQQ